MPHFGPAEELALHVWHSDRVVLIGDAARACSPTMAQGGLAIEDAVVLAEELSRTRSVTGAAEAFVARRQSRVARVRDRTHVELRCSTAEQGISLNDPSRPERCWPS